MNMPTNINTVNMSISTPVNQRHKHEQYVNSAFANCTYGTERIPYLWTNANDRNELLVLYRYVQRHYRLAKYTRQVNDYNLDTRSGVCLIIMIIKHNLKSALIRE